MQGFERAQQEYEAKMFNPFEDEDIGIDEDCFVENEIEELTLRKVE